MRKGKALMKLTGSVFWKIKNVAISYYKLDSSIQRVICFWIYVEVEGSENQVIEL
ncbi:MAG: hypothetical protein QW096_13405 [Thermofilaceae archaeon]